MFQNTLAAQEDGIILYADRLWDGEQMHTEWAVKVEGNLISYAGPKSDLLVKKSDRIVAFSDATMMPGLIEGHAHMLLHPYNETSWNDQVLKESIAERSIRAAIHAEKTLLSGFTTVRDLGSEGAGYADVGLKQSIEKGIIKGPRLIVSGPAIVATGSYGPKGFAEQVIVPLGAIEADGHDALIKEVRRQIGGGADFIKVYADYRWGPNREAMPSFSLDELKLIVETAASSGRVVVAHATTREGMRRATMAGVRSIEHGDEGDIEIFRLMREFGVALCPTLAAGDAILQYAGWNKKIDPEPDRISKKKKSFREALQSGVEIMAGGDVGVFEHGDNVRELVLMSEYGMSPMELLKSVTSRNAKILNVNDKLGRLKTSFLADIVIVNGNPLSQIQALKEVIFVMKNGIIYLE